MPITYNIKECNSPKKKNINLDELMKQIDKSHNLIEIENISTIYYDEDETTALELEYSTNYTVKELSQILDYYKITRRKMRKDEMVQTLIMFEQDTKNIEISDRRKTLMVLY